MDNFKPGDKVYYVHSKLMADTDEIRAAIFHETIEQITYGKDRNGDVVKIAFTSGKHHTFTGILSASKAEAVYHYLHYVESERSIAIEMLKKEFNIDHEKESEDVRCEATIEEK